MDTTYFILGMLLLCLLPYTIAIIAVTLLTIIVVREGMHDD